VASDHVWLDRDGEPLPFRCDEEILDFLRTARIVTIKDLPVGSTKPKKLLLERDGVEAHAVFRYVDIEKRRHRLDDGSFHLLLRDSYRHGLAAYELNRLLGLHTIPPIVPRRVKGRDGSVQLWVENAMTEASRLKQGLRPPDMRDFAAQAWKMQIFDALICNIDRNKGNILFDKSWRLWYIDHTRSFARYQNHPFPDGSLGIDPDLLERLRSVEDETIRTLLGPYLGTFQIEDLLKRRARLVTHFEQGLRERDARRRAQEQRGVEGGGPV